jgi:hypothetical protein
LHSQSTLLPNIMTDPAVSNHLRKSRLTILLILGGVLMIPAFFAWVVNVEIGMRTIFPGWKLLESVLPSFIYDSFLIFSDDLSTISTFIPLLLILYPLVMSWKVWKLKAEQEGALSKLEHDPYPDNFPFFLVMLGLVGTLYGLLIGLDVSGVKSIGEDADSPDRIKNALDQLLGGTSTALLSSLIGLLGAFLAAKPLTAFFHWAACLPKVESVGLGETIEGLVEDMKTLSNSSREFSERLNSTHVQEVSTTLSEIRTEMTGLRQELSHTNQIIEGLGEAQKAGQSMLGYLGQLGRLENLETLLERMGNAYLTASQSNDRAMQSLQAMGSRHAEDSMKMEDALRSIATTLSDVETAGRDSAEQIREVVSQLNEANESLRLGRERAEVQRQDTIELLQAVRQDRNADRKALRNAFGQFIQSDDKPAADQS